MTDGLRDDQLERIVTAVETIESSLEILAGKRTMSRDAYERDRETRGYRRTSIREADRGGYRYRNCPARVRTG